MDELEPTVYLHTESLNEIRASDMDGCLIERRALPAIGSDHDVVGKPATDPKVLDEFLLVVEDQSDRIRP